MAPALDMTMRWQDQNVVKVNGFWTVDGYVAPDGGSNHWTQVTWFLGALFPASNLCTNSNLPTSRE